ncbi:hypothetical protein Bbelb_133250 [Branchiostoma belcheri]|nr:hypothetical protein Bbelb_133250 [Branchiostoma belcheri]
MSGARRRPYRTFDEREMQGHSCCTREEGKSVYGTAEKLNERPYLIYNADETGMTVDAKKPRVIVSTTSKRVPSISLGGRDHITVTACVSASGTVIPPMIIFSKSRPSGNFSEGGPPVLTTAMKENNLLYGLPPHTSHFSQPLDVTVFLSLKNLWALTLQSTTDQKLTARVMTHEDIVEEYEEKRKKENPEERKKKPAVCMQKEAKAKDKWKQARKLVGKDRTSGRKPT